MDVPDLLVIPPEHSSMRSIWMGAGPEPEALHLVLNWVSKIRRSLRLPSLESLSKLFYWVLNLMKFGEHRGGMFVEAEGMVDGKLTQRSWHLLAEGDDGPCIPSMSIETLVRKQLAGRRPEPGTRSAVKALELDELDAVFARKTIYSGFREDAGEVKTLYQRALGSAFDNLPESLKALHGAKRVRKFAGEANVTRGTGLLAKFVAALFGFPKSAKSVGVSVTITPEEVGGVIGENWLRNFSGKRFSSYQSIGNGRYERLVTEKFGWFTVALGLVVKDEKLFLIPRHWRLLKLPLPKFFLPHGESYETEIDDKIHFNVSIGAPIIGLIVHYEGTLVPEDAI